MLKSFFITLLIALTLITSTAKAQTIDPIFDLRLADSSYYDEDITNLTPTFSSDYTVDKMIYDTNISQMVGGGTHGTDYVTLIRYYMEPRAGHTTFDEFNKVYLYDLDTNKKPTRVVSLMDDTNYYYMLVEYTLGLGARVNSGSTILKIEKANPNNYSVKDLSTVFMAPQYDPTKSLKGGFAELSIRKDKIVGTVTQVRRTFLFSLSTATLLPASFGCDLSGPAGRADGVVDGYNVIDMPKGGEVGTRINGDYVIFTREADTLGKHYAVRTDKNGIVKTIFNDVGQNYRAYDFADESFDLVGVKFDTTLNQIIAVGSLELSNKILMVRLKQNLTYALENSVGIIEENRTSQHAITVADFAIRPESGNVVLFGQYTMFEARPAGYGFYTSQEQIDNDIALGVDVYRSKNAYVAVMGNNNEMIDLGTSTAITSDFQECAHLLTGVGVSYNQAGFTAGAVYLNDYFYLVGNMDDGNMPFAKIQYTPDRMTGAPNGPK